jgi:hypothetical protein
MHSGFDLTPYLLIQLGFCWHLRGRWEIVATADHNDGFLSRIIALVPVNPIYDRPAI